MKLKNMLVIGVAVLGLAAGFATSANAQEQFVRKQLFNSVYGTDYQPTGGTNVLIGEGQVINIGGTNNITLTNLLTANNVVSNAPTTATSFSLADFQNVPVWWNISLSAGGAGTSNTVFGLDLTPDGVNWIANVVQATVPATGTSTNNVNVYFPLNNGTNAFSGFARARWSFLYTQQTNNISVHQNQLQAFTSKSH